MNTSRAHALTMKGFTLVELIVAIGLFSVVMTLATGAYLVMIGVQRQTQGLATGIDNLSFVVDSVTTAIRTGTKYICDAPNPDGDCTNGSQLSFIDQQNRIVTYTSSYSPSVCGTQPAGLTGCVVETVNGATIPLTAPSVGVSALTFNLSGSSNADTLQPYVTIRLSGIVSVSPGKTQSFSVESSAAMRGTDL